MTESEKLLWNELREKKVNGFRFLRQHPVFYRIQDKDIKFYIADFYCAKLRLIIELDGPIHDYTVEKDRERDSNLEERGYIVKRYKNEDLADMPGFISELACYLNNLQELNNNPLKTANPRTHPPAPSLKK